MAYQMGLDQRHAAQLEERQRELDAARTTPAVSAKGRPLVKGKTALRAALAQLRARPAAPSASS